MIEEYNRGRLGRRTMAKGVEDSPASPFVTFISVLMKDAYLLTYRLHIIAVEDSMIGVHPMTMDK